MSQLTQEVENSIRSEAAVAGIQRFVMGAVIVRRFPEPKVLVLTRVADDFMGGIEELPSGKVDEGESFETSLVREIKEETGLSVLEVDSFLWSFEYISGSGRKTLQPNFLVYPGDEAVVINDKEHSEYRWMAKEEVAASLLTDNIKEALALHWPV